MARFVQKHNNTNVIIVNIPHRYDLDRTSVINSEIQAFNEQILKVAKAYSHVTIVNTDLESFSLDTACIWTEGEKSGQQNCLQLRLTD